MSPELQKNLKNTLEILKGLYNRSDEMGKDLEMSEDDYDEESLELGGKIYGYEHAIATMLGVPEDNVTQDDLDGMNCDEFFNKETDWPEDLWSRDPYEDAIYDYCKGEVSFEKIVDIITHYQNLAKDFVPRKKQTV